MPGLAAVRAAGVASIQSGTVFAEMSYLVTADTGSNKGNTFHAQVPLTDADTGIVSCGDGWPSNGQGAARGSMNGQFAQVQSGASSLKGDLITLCDIFAKSGCCGGLQPGGQVYLTYKWQSTLLLPGDDDDQWTVTLRLNSKVNVLDPDNYGNAINPLPRFTFSIDGQPEATLNPNNSPAEAEFQLKSGVYLVTYETNDRLGLNIRGAGDTREGHATVSQTLSIAGQQSE